MSVAAVVGLGYVGLPLAVELEKKQRTIGSDPAWGKVARCRRGIAPAVEIPTSHPQFAPTVIAAGNAAAIGSENPRKPDALTNSRIGKFAGVRR